MKGLKLFLACIWFVCILQPINAFGASLDKYQMAPAQRGVIYQPQPNAVKPVEPISPVFQKFRDYVRSQSDARKEELIEIYNERKKAALARKDWNQASYYNNLVQILLEERGR